MNKVIERISHIKNYPLPIKEINTLGGYKVIFENEEWILVRPSGTEPLLRVYIEAKEQNLNILKTFMNETVKSFFRK